MNLSIIIHDFLRIDGCLKTYKFVPINEYNKIVVDKLSDIYLDVKGNTDQDIGMLRIYNSDKCDLSTTNCKLKNFENNNGKALKFKFEHMYIPIDYSNRGSCGYYYFTLPIGYRLTDIHIIDPFHNSKGSIKLHKHFKYSVYWDDSKQLQMIQMQLRSQRGSFSFVVMGKASIRDDKTSFVDSEESEIYLDEEINGPFFDKQVKKILLEKS